MWFYLMLVNLIITEMKNLQPALLILIHLMIIIIIVLKNINFFIEMMPSSFPTVKPLIHASFEYINSTQSVQCDKMDQLPCSALSQSIDHVDGKRSSYIIIRYGSGNLLYTLYTWLYKHCLILNMGYDLRRI